MENVFMTNRKDFFLVNRNEKKSKGVVVCQPGKLDDEQEEASERTHEELSYLYS